jgi:hypothetical protein
VSKHYCNIEKSKATEMNSIKFVTGPKRLIVGPKKSHGGTKYKNLNQWSGYSCSHVYPLPKNFPYPMK